MQDYDYFRRFPVSNVISSMDHWKKRLDLEIGDTIIWRGEGLRNEESVTLLDTDPIG